MINFEFNDKALKTNIIHKVNNSMLVDVTLFC